MMTRCYTWGFALLITLPAVVYAAPAGKAIELCGRLVQESREVDRLLRTVSDRESGQKVAEELRARMEFLQHGAGQLSQMPIENAEEARQLEQLMRDMMHITQGYMPVVQRLVEVNAYGAEELLQLFQFYKMSTPDAGGDAQGTVSPLVRCYTEWCDSIDDALYLLRRVQGKPTAGESVVEELSSLASRVEMLSVQAERMQSGLSPQQLESELLPINRMQRLRNELKSEARRLYDAGCFGNAQLEALVESLLRAARA